MKTNTANRFLLLLTMFVALAFQGYIKDKCQNEYTYYRYEPIYMTYEELRSSVASEAPHALKNPGKIWFSDNYIFINEKNEGIHVVNNVNPSSPIIEAFIKIPGNLDMAVRNNTLYADSYIDLVAIDVTSPTSVTVTKRIENALPQRGTAGFGNAWDFATTDPNGVITDYKKIAVTEAYETDCNGNSVNNGPVMFEDGGFANSFDATSGGVSNASSNTSGDVGNKGGSMARFAMYQNYLYIVDNSFMHLYDISNATSPVYSTQVQVGWEIETIFMRGSYIYIGSTSGMHIYDNSSPSNPTWLSTYSHVRSCDPVVVDGNYAYVTLRSGTPCEGFTNQLDVVDVSNKTNPTLVASYQMTNPHGLGIADGTLFICDGADGLKVYDASNPLTIGDNQLQHFAGIDAYDVIPFQKRLFMIGNNGFYQYDYTDPTNLVLMSTISAQ
jgi:hypothetical protein